MKITKDAQQVLGNPNDLNAQAPGAYFLINDAAALEELFSRKVNHADPEKYLKTQKWHQGQPIANIEAQVQAKEIDNEIIKELFGRFESLDSRLSNIEGILSELSKANAQISSLQQKTETINQSSSIWDTEQGKHLLERLLQISECIEAALKSGKNSPAGWRRLLSSD